MRLSSEAMNQDKHKNIKTIIIIILRVCALISFLIFIMPLMLLLADPGIIEASVSSEKINENALEMVSKVFPDIPFEEYDIIQLEARYNEWEAKETYLLTIRVNESVSENEIKRKEYGFNILNSAENYTDIRLSYTLPNHERYDALFTWIYYSGENNTSHRYILCAISIALTVTALVFPYGKIKRKLKARNQN